MFVATAIDPATLLVSAQISPMIVPPINTATSAPSHLRMLRRVIGEAYAESGAGFPSTPFRRPVALRDVRQLDLSPARVLLEQLLDLRENLLTLFLGLDRAVAPREDEVA